MAAIQKLASAIYNDIVGGLRGYHSSQSISIELIEDEIINTRLSVIKEYSLKGILPIKDLLTSINCVLVDCKDLDRCKCNSSYTGKPVAHFLIPLIISDGNSIEYIGTTDRQLPFIWYTSANVWNYYHKYRKRGKAKPFVYIDLTPNEDGMIDGYIFNAPLLELISVVAAFKDPRQLEAFSCCGEESKDENLTFIDLEVHKRIVELKIRYYRLLAPPLLPNDLSYVQ